MKLKKILGVLLAAVMMFAVTACGSGSSSGADGTNADGKETAAEGTNASGGVALADLKVGFIFIGDENEGYTAAHQKGANDMMESLGVSKDQVTFKYNILEGDECLEAAQDLADSGCNIIFANSFGHESYIMQVAKEFPDIQFCHATGYQASSSGLSNMHNYFTAVYESRYVSGVVAGMKLNEMIEKGEIKAEDAKIGYVGAYPFAEVKSGFTAFYLGAKSVCESVTMEVQYTSSWGDQALELQTADALIADGCVLISQHADTVGAPTACEKAGVPVVGYNISMIEAAPNMALTSASIDWAPYYTYAVKCVLEGKAIDVDWCQGYSEGADKITELNEKAVAEGTAEKVKEVEDAIKAGTLHVFDTSTFTVGGMSLEDYLKSDKATEDEKALAANVSDGYYHESEAASAPSFAFVIDGITSKE